MVKLDIFVGNCNTLNDSSDKVCVPNKGEDLNVSVFNMITEMNELQTLTKHISYQCKCKFDGRKHNEITINIDVTVKNIIYGKKIMFRIVLHVDMKMENI